MSNLDSGTAAVFGEGRAYCGHTSALEAEPRGIFGQYFRSFARNAVPERTGEQRTGVVDALQVRRDG